MAPPNYAIYETVLKINFLVPIAQNDQLSSISTFTVNVYVELYRFKYKPDEFSFTPSFKERIYSEYNPCVCVELTLIQYISSTPLSRREFI